MSRPNFISHEDIVRWDDNLQNDPYLSPDILSQPIILELCYAGLWLTEELTELRCPDEYIVRIQYTAGKLSYGRDPWEVHQQLLDEYIANTLQFEEEPNPTLN
jgi:hypothetical protein